MPSCALAGWLDAPAARHALRGLILCAHQAEVCLALLTAPSWRGCSSLPYPALSAVVRLARTAACGFCERLLSGFALAVIASPGVARPHDPRLPSCPRPSQPTCCADGAPFIGDHSMSLLGDLLAHNREFVSNREYENSKPINSPTKPGRAGVHGRPAGRAAAAGMGLKTATPS